MFRFLKGQFWLNHPDHKIVLALGAGVGLAAEVLTVFMTLYTREPYTVLLGSGITLVLGLFFLTLIFAGHFFIEFDIGLSMGATRRRMLAAGLFNCLCLEGVLLAVTAALRALEWAVYVGWLQKSLPGLLPAVDFLGVLLGLPLWGKLLLLAGPIFLGFVGGVLIQRFGRRGFWVLWGAFMLGFVLPSNALSWDTELLHTAAGLAGLLGMLGWIGAAGAAALGGWAVWLALHASVRSE